MRTGGDGVWNITGGKMPRKADRSKCIDLLQRADKIAKEDAKRPKRTVFVAGPGAGDKLAAGAPSATYTLPDVGQENWDRIWLSDAEFFEKYSSPKEPVIGQPA
jgi:hypothetical protein